MEAALSALRFIYHLLPKQGCRSARRMLWADRGPDSLFLLGSENAV